MIKDFFKKSWLADLIALLKNDAKYPRYRAQLTLIFFHSIFLLILTIVLQYVSFIRSDEIDFLKGASVIKHDILRMDEKPFADQVVFIDVSKDPALADDDEYGPPDSTMKGAQRIITDRIKLSKLFSILNAHPSGYKYIICDILFEKPGPGDDVLKPQIEKLHNVIASAVWENDKLVRPIYKVHWGVVNYTAINRIEFTKMLVYYKDTLKSLPAKLFEKMTPHRFTKKRYLTYLDGHPAFNTVIPEFYYRSVDMVTPMAGKNANTFYLGELLADPDCFSVLKDKFIVIGDFTNDIHTTYLGKMAGTLILWNTFLTMYKHQVVISAGWLLMLFVFYFMLSYWIMIHPDKKLSSLHKKIRIPFLSSFLINYLSFIGILIIINIISYFNFGTFVSLLYIATYLTFLHVLAEKYPRWKQTLYDYLVSM